MLGVLTQEGRQITLKHLADRLNGIRHAEPEFETCDVSLELDRREARRDLVHALRVLLDWGVLARIDGSEDRFVTSEETDVLYNVRHAILGRLLTARQPPSLVHTQDFEAQLNALWRGTVAAADSEDWHTRQIRYGLFRRLLDDPVLYYRDLDEDERQYLDTQRPHIVREIEQATGLLPEIREEGIAMVDRVGDLSDYHLPETGTDGHLTLLIATWLAEELRNSPGQTVLLTRIEEKIRTLAATNSQWRKDARQKGSEVVLARETIARLGALGLLCSVSEPESAVIPLPAIGRFGLRLAAQPSAPQKTLF